VCCRWYTAAEVGTHCTIADCWITIQGIVYDLTSLLPKNPEVLNEVRKEKEQNSFSALMTLYFLVESNAKNVSSSETSAIIMDLGYWVHGFLFGK
jgi:hypothetical protein